MKGLTAYIKQTTLFPLLAVFLLSSTGFNVCSHTCKYSGNTDFSLVLQHKSESCCSDMAAERKSCCDDKDMYFKLDVVKKIEEENHSLPRTFFAMVAFQLPDFLSPSLTIYSSAFISHSPPILSAGMLLSLVQVFRL